MIQIFFLNYKKSYDYVVAFLLQLLFVALCERRNRFNFKTYGIRFIINDVIVIFSYNTYHVSVWSMNCMKLNNQNATYILFVSSWQHVLKNRISGSKTTQMQGIPFHKTCNSSNNNARAIYSKLKSYTVQSLNILHQIFKVCLQLTHM